MTNHQGGQLTLFDLDTWSGRTCPEFFPPQTERTSERFLRKPAELLTAPFLYLDLRKGYGNLLGPFWAINSPLLGEFTMLNTGESHKDAGVSSLSQILEDTPHHKYYLSRTACLGILRRAKKRGKELPPILKHALLSQGKQ